MPEGTKPLSEPVLIYHQGRFVVFIWVHCNFAEKSQDVNHVLKITHITLQLHLSEANEINKWMQHFNSNVEISLNFSQILLKILTYNPTGNMRARVCFLILCPKPKKLLTYYYLATPYVIKSMGQNCIKLRHQAIIWTFDNVSIWHLKSWQQVLALASPRNMWVVLLIPHVNFPDTVGLTLA